MRCLVSAWRLEADTLQPTGRGLSTVTAARPRLTSNLVSVLQFHADVVTHPLGPLHKVTVSTVSVPFTIAVSFT